MSVDFQLHALTTVFTFFVEWGQSLWPLPSKSSVHEGIYLLPEFKNQNHFFSPQTVTFHLSFIWTCLVSIGFINILQKTYISNSVPFKLHAAWLGRGGLSFLWFLFLLNWLYHQPSSCLQSSSQIFSSCWQKAGSAETAGHNCWKGPLWIQHSF